MGYIEQSLAQNEVVHYRAHFHWLRISAGWGALTLFVATAAYLHNFVWLARIDALVGVALFLAIMVPVWTTEVGVTNLRLIFKRGFLGREIADLQLRSIEQVNLKQSVFGRLLGFGRVVVHGTGVDDVMLPTLADPVSLQRALQEAMGSSPPASTAGKRKA